MQGAITLLWAKYAFAAGSRIGWWLAIILMAAIRELSYSEHSRPLRGYLGITFI